MNKDWDDLRYVLALARHGSMSSAARALNTNNATVSRRIHAMAERFGQPVFHKVKGGWQLTSFGEGLLDVAVALDEALYAVETEKTVTDVPAEVMVTSLDFVNRSILFPNLREFHSENPTLQMNLHNSNENLSLAYGEADMAIRLGRPTSHRLVGEKLSEIPCSLFAPIGVHTNEWVALEEELDWVPEARMAFGYFGKSPRLRVTDYKAVQAASKATQVACFLPDVIANQAGGLERIPGSPTVSREAWLLYHDSRKGDASIAAVAAWVRHSFQKADMVAKPARGEGQVAA